MICCTSARPEDRCDKCQITTAEDISVDLQRAFERELGRRTGSAVRITATNVNSGLGTYVTAAGAKRPFTFSGDTITTPVFAPPVNRDRTDPHETVSFDPYRKALAEMRAAAATDASTFEDGYKADRLRALDAEYARRDAEPRLTVLDAADLVKAPDAYAAGLKLLRERDAARAAAKESR
jgi:hypothetical protein